MMELVSSQRRKNQVQPIYIEFLQFVQTYHVDPSYQLKKMFDWSEKLGFKFHQAWWMDKFKEYTRNETIDFDKDVILSGLRDLKSIQVGKGVSLHGTDSKCVIINAAKLEEETNGLIAASEWSKQKYEMLSMSADEELEQED